VRGCLLLLLNLLVSLLLPQLFASLRKHSSTLCAVVNSRDHTETLRSTFTEEDRRTNFEVLRAVHEAKFDVALVTCSKEILVHFEYFCGLSNDATVNYSLVVWLDGGGMMKNDHFGIKVISGLRV